MKNEAWFKDILSTVKFGEGFPVSKFYFHPLYRVGVGRETNLDYVFGKKRQIPFKNLRKFKFFTFEAPFPPDSVVFFQPERKRLLVASKKENKVLKVSSVPGRVALLDGEIEKLNHQNNSDFAPHSVKLLGHGPDWIMTSFCSNLDSVSELDFFSLHKLLMGPMTKFYQSHPFKVIGLKDWIRLAQFRAHGHPSMDLIQKLIQNLEKGPGFDVVHGQLHFDLHAGNVLREGDKVVIIDWEVSYPGLLLIDYFDFFRRDVNKKKIQGETAVKTLQESSFFLEFQNWMKLFGVAIPNGAQAQILNLYALERALIYFERWKEDRLFDKKGFERSISLIGSHK